VCPIQASLVHHRLQLKLVLEFVEFGDAAEQLELGNPTSAQQGSRRAWPTWPRRCDGCRSGNQLAASNELWDRTPGIDQLAATSLVAEIGANMDQFPSAHDFARAQNTYLAAQYPPSDREEGQKEEHCRIVAVATPC